MQRSTDGVGDIPKTGSIKVRAYSRHRGFWERNPGSKEHNGAKEINISAGCIMLGLGVELITSCLGTSIMSLVVPEAHQQFQVQTLSLILGTLLMAPVKHILRLLNTNVDGKRKIMYALTEIKGVGRRYANLVCKKADVDLNKR